MNTYNELTLPELLFLGYRTDESPHTEGPIAIRQAEKITEDNDYAMAIAQKIAETIDPDMKGEVVGFFVRAHTPDEPGEPDTSLSLLNELNELEPLHLWERTAAYLSAQIPGVLFRPRHHTKENGLTRPGIHGARIQDVNGAMIELLFHEGLEDHLPTVTEYFANAQSPDGWVYRK